MSISQHRFNRALRCWLRSEQDGSERAAERHLRQAFELLSPPTPGPLFVESTMRRLGVDYRATVSAPSGLFKLLVSACLTAAGVALTLAPGVLAPFIGALRPALVVQWWTSVLVALSQRFASGLAVWKVLTEIGETVALAVTSPLTMAALTGALVVSFATFRVLSGLVSFERGAQNV